MAVAVRESACCPMPGKRPISHATIRGVRRLKPISDATAHRYSPAASFSEGRRKAGASGAGAPAARRYTLKRNSVTSPSFIT